MGNHDQIWCSQGAPSGLHGWGCFLCPFFPGGKHGVFTYNCWCLHSVVWPADKDGISVLLSCIRKLGKKNSGALPTQGLLAGFSLHLTHSFDFLPCDPVLFSKLPCTSMEITTRLESFFSLPNFSMWFSTQGYFPLGWYWIISGNILDWHMCWSSFHCCDKMPETINLNGGELI